MTADARGFSRRVFLRGAAGAALVALTVRVEPSLAAALDRGATLSVADHPDTAGQAPASPVIQLSAARDTDLMLADFTFYGFTVDTTSKPRALVATTKLTGNNWVGVVVQLPPQAIGEADYDYEKGLALPFDPTPVLSAVSGPSQLAFTFSTGDKIPLPTMTVADLLDWTGWTLNVPATAIAGAGIEPGQPTAIETAIECPYALILAPAVDNSGPVLGRFSTYFDNRTEPFVYELVTECWTTSLAGSPPFLAPQAGYVPPVAAVWAADYANGAADATPETNVLYGAAPPIIK